MTAAIEKNIIDPLAQWILKEAEAGKERRARRSDQGLLCDGKIVFAASKKPEKNTARTNQSRGGPRPSRPSCSP